MSCRRLEWTEAVVATSRFPLVRSWDFGPLMKRLSGEVVSVYQEVGRGASSESVRFWSMELNFYSVRQPMRWRLPEVAKQSGIDLNGHRLRRIIVAGETGGSSPAFRERIGDAWGNDLAVHDHYGMTEVGPVAYEILEAPECCVSYLTVISRK